MKRRDFLAALPMFAGASRVAWSDESSAYFNWRTPTAGGLQFWGDVAFSHQWRIQRNVVTGHHRLLDENGSRHTWGSYETCRSKLDDLGLPPMQSEAVVLLHGLRRSRRHMAQLADHLRQQDSERLVFCMGYPSLRAGVDQHAEQLESVMRSLEGVPRVHFVAHSLGNLVIRRWMRLNQDADTGEPRDGRVGRFVMLGPPNNRPSLGRLLAPLDPTHQIAGPSGCDLCTEWDTLATNLAIPSGEFGIIAGGKGDEAGWNPLLPGDDDTTVCVEEAQLPGADDFRIVPVTHSAMPTDQRIHSLTSAFLQTGRFGSESDRQRI